MRILFITILCSSILARSSVTSTDAPVVLDKPVCADFGLYAGFTNEDLESYEVVDVQDNDSEQTSEPSFSQYELDLLAKLIYRETGAQGWDCMVACGSVVMNRVNSKSYPNTIEDVIYQRGQYSVVRNRDRFLNTVPSSDAYEVAELILTDGSQIPDNVIYQGKSKTIGSGIWKIIECEVYCYD